MAWRVAKALDTLLEEVNRTYPKREKAADGSIGDAAHASRSSDHNPWVKIGALGIVTARDFDHDPDDLNGHALAEHLAARAKAGDKRIKYIIWNGRIFNPSKGMIWRTYNGPNKHTGHVHLSVSSNLAHYDSEASWGFKEPTLGDRNLRVGRSGADVRTLQGLLGVKPVDGDYGPITERAVRTFQAARGLAVDGEVGPKTLAALRAAQVAPRPTPAPPAPKPTPAPVVEPVIEEDERVYVVYSKNGQEFGTDGVSVVEFLSQKAKNEWVELTGAKRAEVSNELHADLTRK